MLDRSARAKPWTPADNHMPTVIPASATSLAGWALAHAVWNVSDTTPSEVLCVFTLTDEADGRLLTRFEADSQEAAILGAEEAVTEQTTKGIAWALAREGIMRTSDDQDGVDAIVVDAWAPGLPQPVSVVQPFERSSAERGFSVGSMILIVAGEVVPEPLAADALVGIRAGVDSHSVVRELWPTWQSAPGRAG